MSKLEKIFFLVPILVVSTRVHSVVVGRTPSPAPLASYEVRILIPGACEYVTSHSRSDFASGLMLRTLRWDDAPGLSR